MNTCHSASGAKDIKFDLSLEGSGETAGICPGLSEPSLLAYAISTKIL